METQTMSNPVGLRATQPQMRELRPTAQVTFVGAWTAILVFCALTWGVTLSLFV